MKKELFQQQIKKHEAQLSAKNRIFRKIGFVKLCHVMFTGFFIYQLFSFDGDHRLLIVSGIIILALVAFWIYHERLKQDIGYAKGMILINQKQIDRITGAWTNFSDIGSEFVDHGHPYASDLDIVGQKSVFQLLNTTHTWHGRKRFAQDLLDPNYTDSDIFKRQAAILELSEDVIFSNDIQYKFAQIGVHSGAKYLVKHLEDQTIFMKNTVLKYVAIYGPLVVLFLAGATFLFRLQAFYPAVLILLSVQIILWLLTFLKCANYLEKVAHLNYNLDAYRGVLEVLKNQPFTSKKLNDIKTCLTGPDTSAILALSELASMTNRAQIRKNGIAFVILNALFLFDITTAIRFEGWKKKYGKHAKEWFDQLGEFESLLSFSHLPNVITTTTLPKINHDKKIEATLLGHPLITNESRVCNDVHIHDHILIISGSNMSGKTTFMRSVGINLILARAGSFVCAKKMDVAPLQLMTSMRLADNLSEGVSTFYAELKRIKGILDLAKTTPNMLFLIDEIFRGTNSVDRLLGAKTILTKLNQLAVTGIITTHDLELCDISTDFSRIKNYSFLEQYHDDVIHFDYLIRTGVSTTTNAKFLMKMMDII